MLLQTTQRLLGSLATRIPLATPPVSPVGPWHWQQLQQIRDRAQGFATSSDRDLARETAALRQRIATGERLDSELIRITAFALVIEAVRRARQVELYDEQVLAGLVLAGRHVAEMQTGEGKTYAASLPAYLHALAGHGVHVVTANHYLAERDYELLGPAFTLLGLRLGLLRAGDSFESKQRAYGAEITYGADEEFGFDFLRDQLRQTRAAEQQPGQRYLETLRGRAPETVLTAQRPLAAAIVDEVDSILIDSSTSPLLLSGPNSDATAEAAIYDAAHRVAAELILERDFLLEPGLRQVRITSAGLQKVSSPPEGIPPGRLCRPWPKYVEQAIAARMLMKRDVDYVVREGKVLLVDEYTGRILPQRQWREGLHQAIEAKEGLEVRAESTSLVRITRQRYFRLYKHLSGMTGTAQGSQREFWDVYRLRVFAIPTRRPCQRRMLPARRFATAAAKYSAMVEEIEQVHRTGQPVLIGARTIENSQTLARALDARGIPYQLLNGHQDLAEATIIARAGQVGSVTIATNMAGRGTDIRLGSGAAELGGLHVIVVEQHEATRIDRQLIGRAARQGDPGSCRIYGSAEDALFEHHAPSLARFLRQLASPSGELTTDLSSTIARLQRQLERQHYYARRRMLRYDRWLDRLREEGEKTG